LVSTNLTLGMRVAIMHIFSYMEAISNLLKSAVIADCADGRWKTRIPEELYLASLDSRYEINEAGSVKKRRKSVPTLGHYLFCFKLVAAYRNVPFDPTKMPFWESVDSALKVRHRLTHPKQIADLEVTPKEYHKCVDAVTWFANCLQETTGCEHQYPRKPQQKSN